MKRFIRLKTGQIIDTQDKKWLGCYERKIVSDQGIEEQCKAFYFRDANIPYGFIVKEADKVEYLAMKWDFVHYSKECHYIDLSTHEHKDWIETGFATIKECRFAGWEEEWDYYFGALKTMRPKWIDKIYFEKGNNLILLAYKENGEWKLVEDLEEENDD